MQHESLPSKPPLLDMFEYCVLVGPKEAIPTVRVEPGQGDGDGVTVINGINGLGDDGDPKGEAAL